MHFVRSCINNQTYKLLWSNDQVRKHFTLDSFIHLITITLRCLYVCEALVLYVFSQLMMMKKKVEALQEFDEGPLDFQPTYKFDLNSDTYDSR